MAHPYACVTEALAGSAFSKVVYADVTGSTNADAAALLNNERARGLSIVAERQTHGSGRKGRSWIAEAGSSLLVTTILPSAVDAASLWAVPFWTALAVRSALIDHGIETTVHWPNDLLAGAGKLAGILCTSRVTGNTAWVGCGVGINVSRVAGSASIEPPAAFCDDVTPVDRAQLLLAILRNYAATLGDLTNPANVAKRWQSAAGIPGARYRIVKDGETGAFEATAVGLSDAGALVVELDDGRRETIALADARVLR